jgi:hypothetical protein
MNEKLFETIVVLVAMEVMVLTIYPGTGTLASTLIGTLVVAPIGAWIFPKIIWLFGQAMG